MHNQENGPGARTVVCPICGKDFTCSLSPDCWCARKKIPGAVSDYLASRYKTCVCSVCVDRLIEQASTYGRLPGGFSARDEK